MSILTPLLNDYLLLKKIIIVKWPKTRLQMILLDIRESRNEGALYYNVSPDQLKAMFPQM